MRTVGDFVAECRKVGAGPQRARRRPGRSGYGRPLRGPGTLTGRALAEPAPYESNRRAKVPVGSVIKKRRKRMAKKKHRKLLKRTRVQRRNKK